MNCMDVRFSFLEWFPKDNHGLYIVYELYTFDNLFRLLLKGGMEHEDAVLWVFCYCSLSALVFQERIHDNGFCKLSARDVFDPRLAARKARLIHDLAFDCEDGS